ncbi:uncharacterized protein TRIVIDRAFT_201746 [Trichoderma virens Gv29-8]|uniref:LysM domain-containing protein n=1 Tax=Hypocrea virens (strain Gv29-8 / FGSC 10586) TaxID=413071 RepID=G9MUY5_HYPVG|nr:uncharacterized protein TRIVIDRAFT_201746 [Trichoderma virens Gv29-8]EHK21759.1 hypothetical protein TRIVIDRAFT_201746 [Trichoderma virens Gv29-8]UKZ52874.1 hypothetical protein TrVGV298_006661 [Trichoderma virens]
MLLSLLTLAVVGYGSVLRSSADNTLDRNRVPNLRRDDTTQLFNVTGMAGLSAKCVQAMESPVSCSNDGMMLLSQADAISGIATPELLTADDLAALCTTSCSNSLASLSEAVEAACSDDVLTFAPSNSTVYIPGTDAQESIFGGSGETFRPSLALDMMLLKYKIGCLRDSAISGSDGWCYLRVNEGLTQACDDCELGAFRAQMEDPGNYDADLAVQYTSQVSSCHKSLTPIATPTKSVFISSTIVTTTETCRGTMVPVAANANCDDFARTHSIGTEQLLSLNGLTSGCVGFPGSKSSLCVVGSCKTYTVTKDDTCSTIVKQAGIADVQFISWNPMLSPQACNRDIAKMVGHVVCISNPLGYTSPSNTGSGPVTTSSSMLGPVTGFDDLPDVSTIWTHAPVTTTTLSADDPFYTPTYELANGSISDCYFMYDNDLDRFTCLSASRLFGVDVNTWIRWNPSVWKPATDDADSDCYLNNATRYCGLFWDPTLATLHNDTVSPYEPKPSDATAGATDECYIWDKTPATAEDNLCTTFISYWGITIDQLYAWNPAVGNNCQSLWLDTSYCVSAEDPTPSTTSSTTALTSSTTTSGGPPAPTRPGTVQGCQKWYVVKSGDSCGDVATQNGITITQLVAWNTDVNPTTCDGFWPDYAYCVKGPTTSSTSKPPSTTSKPPSSTSKPPSTTSKPPSSTASSGAPAPTRPGTVQGCQKWYVVKSGDSCGDVATQNGITITQFVAWNTDVNPTTCDGFWPDYAYCVKGPTISSTSKPPSTTSKPPSSTSKPPSTTSKPPSSTSKPPSTTSKPSATTPVITPPGPTQSGIPAKCNKFALTQSGDGCETFATRNKITLAQLYSWNPVLGNACNNFWLGEAYCVGVSA